MQLTGLGVSPGVATGRALVLKQSARDVRYLVSESRVGRELGRLAAARDRSRQQLVEIRERIADRAGAEHAYLFDAQLLMLDDPMLAERASTLVRAERVNAEWAVRRAGDELLALFDQAHDPYLRERKGDMVDVVGRLHMNLRGGPAQPDDWLRDLRGPFILVADMLPPSLAAQVDWRQVAGFVSEGGSWTSHTAILARSLHVPAVSGVRDACARIGPGVMVALDGTSGEVRVDPSETELAQFQLRRERRAAFERSLDEFRARAAVTRDGLAIRLEANLELPEDLERARQSGAEGIGLFRSEFLLRGRPVEGLTEDAQYDIYRAIVEGMAPQPVTIRTFDVTIDDLHPRGEGRWPSGRLGLQGIRLALARRDVLRTQLRALLRAAAHGTLRIMFPFVSGVEELREARAVLAEARAELRARDLPAPAVPVGVMIEVPSAAWIADLLAAEADFVSVGTNDLIQYSLAADRTDDRVAYLYQPLHPAILRALRQSRRGARRAGIPLSVCGEMASDPSLLVLLVGLGISSFSMAPTAIPLAKQILGEISAAEARAVAGRALRCRTAREIEEHLSTYLTLVREPGRKVEAWGLREAYGSGGAYGDPEARP